ncbi:class I SAM-dependent methyltransferase [Cytobacillus oceanisediminis]|uniref:class I SAM-dependent methyltransferase n=1 Tax=Cytobacillus oceanisediminis TaxID=665099 RepID=UPI001F28BC7C|nr:class I SAM-dependent methyltransferase [Cytobacillus oceanisediminis]
MIPIKNTYKISDIGAGTGYITVPAARATAGMVYALDIDGDMLDVIKSKVEKEKNGNIIILKESINHIPLPDNSIGLALASLVLHEMPSLPRALRQINECLSLAAISYVSKLKRKTFQKKDIPELLHLKWKKQLNLQG